MKIDYKQMIEMKLSALDVRGHRVTRVRSVEEVDGGINVSVLHNTHYKNFPVLGYSDEEGSCDGVGVIEFTAFIPGGTIGPRPE
jgi:hypothetical protein